MLDLPVYFLTWTTYGSRLPGDERGWVDYATASAEAPVNETDRILEQRARRRLQTQPIRLTRHERDLVETTVQQVCDHRQWRLLACNCRTNHAHVVVVAPAKTPETVMNALKSWCSRRLNERRGLKRRNPWWTRHSSTRWLNREIDVWKAVDYVDNQQDHPERPRPRQE